MSKFIATVKEETLKLFPPTIFFFVALHLVALVRSLMVKGTGLPVMSSLAITIAALILGKSVLIADLLPIINRFPEKPLVYNIVWKTLIYLVVASLLHYLEHLYDFWRETGGLMAANSKMLAELSWPRYWAVQIVLAIIILAYVTMRELSRVIGGQTFKRMFFGPLPSSLRASAP